MLNVIRDLVREGTPQSDNLAPHPSIANLVEQLERIARPGTRLFIISDFHDLLDADHLAPLRRLTRKTQIVAISITDALEAELPRAGYYAVTDGDTHSQASGNPTLPIINPIRL
ncbi:MAG: hypothetical protein O2876_08860 [Proteobacteria bacterium]|nr:hypothetical protein [Pseudomonadota bacterium]